MRVVFTMSQEEIEQACREWVSNRFGVNVESASLRVLHYSKGYKDPQLLTGDNESVAVEFSDVSLPTPATPYRG